MEAAEAEKWIREHIEVTRQKVTIAKAFVVQEFAEVQAAQDGPTAGVATNAVVQRFLQYRDAVLPERVVWSSREHEPIEALRKAADSISWQLAVYEGVWQLIHSGVLLRHSPTSVKQYEPIVSYERLGHGAGWHFRDLHISYPSAIRRALSVSDNDAVLCNADLYIRQIDAPGMDPSVEEALREAVLCFRHELYTACVVMLGKAAEEVWIDVGIALYKTLPGSNEDKIEKLKSPHTSIKTAIQEVSALYQKPEFGALRKLGLKTLWDCVVWSDLIRESRNVVHAGAVPSTANSYEKVAALLLSTVPRLRELYRVKGSVTESGK